MNVQSLHETSSNIVTASIKPKNYNQEFYLILHSILNGNEVWFCMSFLFLLNFLDKSVHTVYIKVQTLKVRRINTTNENADTVSDSNRNSIHSTSVILAFQ